MEQEQAQSLDRREPATVWVAPHISEVATTTVGLQLVPRLKSCQSHLGSKQTSRGEVGIVNIFLEKRKSARNTLSFWQVGDGLIEGVAAARVSQLCCSGHLQ